MMIEVVKAIHEERQRQDAQWGGKIHDDEHTSDDFLSYILKQCHKGMSAENEEEVRAALIKIGALSVAALESIQRKNPK